MAEAWDKWLSADGIPSQRTLQRWRKRAEVLAKRAGAEGACHICKRPVGYRRGTIELYATRTWRQPPLRFRICARCERTIRSFLDLLQVELRRADWPVDMITENKDGN